MQKIKERISQESINLGSKIKTRSGINPYSYLIITSANFYVVLFSLLENIEPKGFKFNVKDDWKKRLNKLTRKDANDLLIILVMEYFAFINQFMDKSFKESLPVDLDTIKQDFIATMNLTKREQTLMKRIDDRYDSAYHSRLILKNIKFPNDLDDLFVIQTMEELKQMLFHRMNKNFVKLLRRVKKRDE